MTKNLIIASFFLALLSFISCSESTPCDCNKPSITIGALLPLSGSGASIGEGAKASLEIAKKEIEDYLATYNNDYKFNLVVADTKTNPEEALQKLKQLSAQGIRVFIGPFGSGEVQSIKQYADANGLLILSPASVAISLAIEGDNIFRFVTSDLFLAKAITRYCTDLPVNRVIPLYRDDVWGDDMVSSLKNNLQLSGASMADGIKYSTTTSDFSQILSQLNDIVSAELNSNPASDITIFMASYGEGSEILKEAANHQKLASVKWIGSSAYALELSLLSPAYKAGAEFAKQQDFACPIMSYDQSAVTKAEQLLAQISQKTGSQPNIYALTTYDALWVALKSILSAGTGANIGTLKEKLVIEASNYNGATGNTTFNAAGDRLKSDYDFWGLEYDEVAETFSWVKVASYNSAQDIIVK